MIRGNSRKLTLNLVILVVATVVWVPHTLPFFTNMASGQIFIAILLAPLAIAGLVCGGFAGAALVEMNHAKIRPLMIFVGVQVACIIGCVLHEIVLVGYPLELCFDFCQPVSLGAVILSYLIATMVMFAPAYLVVITHRKERIDF